jgi:hypothetical protein
MIIDVVGVIDVVVTIVGVAGLEAVEVVLATGRVQTDSTSFKNAEANSYCLVFFFFFCLRKR